MKLLIGNFKGPKGEQGNEGKKGDNGDKGEKGERGSRWTSGTAITGTSTTETIFADSGITDAKIDDYYINTTTGNLYQCTASGAADTAKWVYIGNFKGPKGNDGPAGSISDINDQIPTYEESTQFENIESGETVKIAFGKLKKALSVFIVHHTQKATAAILGHVKLSNSAAITKAGEYALDAIEKNAAIEGTLANLINSLNSKTYWNLTEINSTLSWETATIADIYRSMREETIACMEFPARCPVANEMDFANSGTIMIFKTNSKFRVPTPIGFAAQAYHPEDTYIINTKSTNGEVSIKVEKVFTKSSILNSTAITKQGEYALDAIEKNAAIEGTLANLINSLNSNLIIYRTWQYLTREEETMISPNETRYFDIEPPVVDGYRRIGVSLQEKHGFRNGELLITYTETMGTIHNPTPDKDLYLWGAVFKFVYIKC